MTTPNTPWQSGLAGGTPLSPARLQNIEDRVTEATDAVDDLEGGVTVAPAKIRAAVTASTYTLLATDIGCTIPFTAACTITIPLGLGAGFWCECFQDGAGLLTFAAGSGVAAPKRRGSLTTEGQYSWVRVEYLTASTVALAGNLAP